MTESIIDSVSEGRDVKQTVEVALAMCQRNSLRNRDDQAEKLWFTLLDKLLRIQNSVKRSLHKSNSLRRTGTNTSTSGAAQTAFQVALNELIRMILERMASSVSLKSILFKITNEHGKGEFGDFRPTIFGMLDTYNYEQSIYQTANGLISVDLYEQVVTLKKALSCAYAPPSNECSYCHVSLSRPPFGMAHSGAAMGGEKWNVSTSMVMIVSRQVFHESCAKAWQQDTLPNRSGSSRQLQNRIDRSGSTTSTISGKEEMEEDSKKKTPSTRRYLNRLKYARKHTRRTVALHVILESLIREDTGRNKYLKSSRAAFSLRPDPEQSNKIKKRIGHRKVGALPIQPIQKGSLAD